MSWSGIATPFCFITGRQLCSTVLVSLLLPLLLLPLRRLTSGSSRTRLLYVTPEKIAKSDVLMRALNALRSEGRLARVVVDEAHCVSQVG
jgi:superfamily II DNA helicase RecQ